MPKPHMSRRIERYRQVKSQAVYYRREIVGRLMYDGTFNRNEIKERLEKEYDISVSPATIQKDIAELNKMWRAHMIRDIDDMKSQAIAELNQVKAEYWKAWDRSIGESVDTTTVESKDKGIGKNTGNKYKSTTTRQKYLAGNPAFLRGVVDTIREQAKILGLNAPLEIDVGSKAPEKYSKIKRAFAMRIVEKHKLIEEIVYEEIDSGGE